MGTLADMVHTLQLIHILLFQLLLRQLSCRHALPGVVLMVFVSSVKVEVLFQDGNDWARTEAWWGQGRGLQGENV